MFSALYNGIKKIKYLLLIICFFRLNKINMIDELRKWSKGGVYGKIFIGNRNNIY
ncbi:hypothetical protein LGMS210922A_18040 [Lactococcus garvieae]|nr:hypothetical protein LGMS210922A_18040 [Lactococcus garvieae]BDW52126.1 hypothetical protein LG21E68_18010 [Lactococcus garvieae]